MQAILPSGGSLFIRIGKFLSHNKLNARVLSSSSYSMDTYPYVSLDDKRSKFCRKGCPVVFGTGVTSVLGEPAPGSDVLIKDSKGGIIGRGFYNPHSQYRVRVIASSSERELFRGSVKEVIQHRIRTARTIRAALNLPSSTISMGGKDAWGTNVYRLINSEGDSLSGLIIDVIGKSVVVQSLALWSEIHRMMIEDILKNELPCNSRIIWRRNATRLVDEGIPLGTIASVEKGDMASEGAKEKEDEDEEEKGEEKEEIVHENGLRYLTYPASGQKTGFYCDQRLNRKLIGQYCKGKNVLDLYCFNGGFSLNALRAGAKSVLAVDSSNLALGALKRNIELNRDLLLSSSEEEEKNSCNIEILQADADAAVKKLLKDTNRRFDVVICDPPKLAPSVASLARATKKYIALNANTMKLVGRASNVNGYTGSDDNVAGGLLFTCTCSAAMTQSGRFVTDVLQPAAKLANKRLTVLSIEGAAPDHTVLGAYPDGRYFEGVLCWISPL